MRVVASTSILTLLLASSVTAFAPAGTILSSTRGIASTLNAEVLEKESEANTEAKVVPSEDLLKESKADDKAEQKFQIKVPEKVEEERRSPIQPGRYNDVEMSLAVPFLKRPTKLDGTHAGDIGFDPLGLSESNDLYTMMEAEIRHSRLAMLAVIGWPLSELIAPNWMLQGSNHLAPSVLNGFNPLALLATAAAFGGLGYLEYVTALRPSLTTEIGKKHAEDMKDVWSLGVPGDYNFDPLNLYSAFGDDAVGRKAMRELEVAHGRGAMMGISYFALYEYLSGHPIVENNMLFHPNLLVPLLGAGYLSFDFFFDVKKSDQYLMQVELNSEGEMRLVRLKNFFKYFLGDAKDNSATAMNIIADISDAAKKVKGKYDDLTDNYTKNTMKNID